MEIIAKLRGHLQFSPDLTGFSIYFSNEKGVSWVHGLVDHYSSRSTVNSRPGQGGALTGAWHTASTEGGSSLRWREKGEGSNAVHTKGFSDRGRGGVELAVVDNGGDESYFDDEAKGKSRGGTRVGVDAGWRRCSRAPFIGPQRERSGRDAKGNGGELQWHWRGSGEDGVGHHFEKRRAGGTIDSASLGTEESIGVIEAAATPAEGGGGCSCSGKKKVKAYFCFFTFLGVGGVKPKDANAEVACWAQRSNGPAAMVEK
jgi:hypothetical protein